MTQASGVSFRSDHRTRFRAPAPAFVSSIRFREKSSACYVRERVTIQKDHELTTMRLLRTSAAYSGADHPQNNELGQEEP